MKAYIHYSGPTSETGEALATALKIEHGRELPTSKPDLYIGWGVKTSKDVAVDAKVVLNHPNQIRVNRNKFEALKRMSAAGVRVMPSIDAEHVMTEIRNASSPIKLPLIGRKNFHQGGKSFWTCPTMSTVAAAIKQGAQYFQRMADIEQEYRVHVLNGKVIYVQKKVEATESGETMRARFAEQQLEKIKHVADRSGVKIDEETAKYVLTRASQPEAPDPIIRSNTRGWKFASVSKYPDDIKTQAIAAVAALGLSFGAVDVGVLYDEASSAKKEAIVIEVNTGPGLSGTPFDAYVAAFNALLTETKPKPTAAEPVAAPAPKTTVAKTDKKLTGAALLKALLKNATDEEQVVLERLLDKVIVTD